MKKITQPHVPLAIPIPTNHRPSWSVFLRGRILSINGVLSGLYLALTVVVCRNPGRAHRAWNRLQGQPSNSR